MNTYDIDEMNDIKDLRTIAEMYNITYSGNTGIATLKEKIKAYIKEVSDDITKETANTSTEKESNNSSLAEQAKQLKEIREAKAAAEKTQIIKIVDNDSRVNGETKNAIVSFSNQYFDLGELVIPLDTPVEVPQGHINVLKETKCMYHVETDDGSSSTPKLRDRYSITYMNELRQPEAV